MTTIVVVYVARFVEGFKNIQDQQTHLKLNDVACGICLQNLSQKQYTTKCKHCFCKECILKWSASQSYLNKFSQTCPLCRSNIKEEFINFKFKIDVTKSDLNYPDEFMDKLESYVFQNFVRRDSTSIAYKLPKNISEDVQSSINHLFQFF